MNGQNPDMEQMEALKKIILTELLTKEARERLGRLKLIKPDVAAQLELYLIQLYQAGKIKEQVTDEQMKSILEMMSPGKKFNIKR
jgi:programmed cell death protein 5